jgi:hypothetical protein
MRADVNGIGGFFELELPQAGQPYHRAPALTSGRACLGVHLDELKPSRVHVPFFVCDALLAPIRSRGLDVAFYPIDERFEPRAIDAAPSDVVVRIDYFGLRGDAACADRDTRTVWDFAQSFFTRPLAGVRAFNSARKWFGVPDGAFLFGAACRPHAVNVDAPYDHLVNRLLGRQDAAFEQFQQSEARITDRPLGMSMLSARLLDGIDYAAVAERRRSNFARLAQRLDPINELQLAPEAGAVPFCYPFLPWQPIDRRRLHEVAIYVPTFWPELTARSAVGFDFERRLAEQLLPLPIDHRIGPVECDRIVDVVLALCGNAVHSATRGRA